MKFRLAALVLSACVVASALPAHAQKSIPADFIVALVNSQPITDSELRQAMRRAREQLQSQQQALPSQEQLRQLVLERLISDKAQLDYALQAGMRVEDAAVDQAEQSLAIQNQTDVATLRQRMQQDGMDPALVRSQLRDQILVTRLREREVDSRIRVTDQDIDRFLAEQQSQNTDPLTQEINLAQILLEIPEKASAEEAAKIFLQARQLQQRALRGEDFATLVQRYSAGSRTNGGEIGLRRGDRYPSLFVQAIANLSVGDISEPVRSGAGVHILKVLERRAPTTYVRTIVQTRARHILLRTGPALSQATATARLAELRQRVVSGKADFAALAREFSQDGSAEQGGDLGWVSPGMFVPEFETVMDQLAEGAISPPVVSRFGVHLIQTLDRRRVDLTPAQVRESVREQLRQTRGEEAYRSWAKDIRERAYVEMREPPP